MLLEKIVNVKSLLLTQKRPQFVDWHRLSRPEKGRLLSLGPICYVTVSHPFVIIKAASVLVLHDYLSNRLQSGRDTVETLLVRTYSRPERSRANELRVIGCRGLDRYKVPLPFCHV